LVKSLPTTLPTLSRTNTLQALTRNIWDCMPDKNESENPRFYL